ncbi:MAG TPA: VWA domain-containing protein [Candidatus Sulfotelmatobacter sp.]|nr:VWA domain-containing protein [Candidatus Sulfotelmatobacter sp.]
MLLSENDASEGLIKIDAIVTDRSGKPVVGLESTDLTLLDNGQPSKILSFQAFNGASVKPEPPVDVILVLDTLRMPGMLASHEREEAEKFLRRNDGYPAQPVSIFRLRDSGLWLLAEPSKDGNALAAEVARDDQGQSVRKALGPSGLFGSAPEDTPGLLALKSLGDILTLERRKPGRKLLIWIGPRREENGAPFDQQRVFNMIVWFSTLLRESRVALYSYSEGENQRDARSARYRDFLSGVRSIRDAEFEDLNRKVLAIQSGGRVLDSSEGLADQIGGCIAEASSFYAMSFNPAPASHPGEYHDLKVLIRTPGLTARSNAGYYDQVYYQDQPDLGAKRVTVEQFEQQLKKLHGKSDLEVAHGLSGLELTERLSDAKLSSEMAEFRGVKTREALIALADSSAFLSPPATEIPSIAPPTASEQRQMIALADTYLNEAIPRLPNFFATRTTVRFAQAPLDKNGSTTEHQPLHTVDSSRERVLYRHGKEEVDSETAKQSKQKADEPQLATYGTFGPILGVASDALIASTDFGWSRWEQDAGHTRAVFRYVIPRKKSHFRVGYCCLPDDDGTISFQTIPGYHGELTLDPTTGAVLRLTTEADLEGDLPIVRSDIAVTFGPVDIGGKAYICPLKSISLWRSRTVRLLALTDWGESFRSYGPFATMLNDINFSDYHIFRAESRVLTDTPTPEKK